MRAAIGLPIELKDEADKNKMGVYFLWFGSKYYIGSTKKLEKRRASHEYNLNKIIDEIGVGKASNYNILKHVFEDLSIDRGIMTLVYEVENEALLAESETLYLKDSNEDENCLNVAQISIRPSQKKEYLLVESLRGGIIDSINECVFKLFYENKFVVVKGKSLVGSLKNISKAVEDFSKKPMEDWPQDHLYLHFIEYILEKGADVPAYKIEIVLVTPNRVELLKAEQTCLWENRNDPDCLNNAVDAYIPVWNEEKALFGWINKGEFLAFTRWKRQNMPQ